MSSKKQKSVYHPQYGNGKAIETEDDKETSLVSFDGKLLTTVATGELFDTYNDWAERNAPDYHR